MRHNFQTRGSAILTALFIMVLVAIAATAMSLRLQIDINRTQSIKDIHTLKRFAEKHVLNSMVLLSNNLGKLSKNNEKIDDIPYHSKKQYDSGINIETYLNDEQGKFNLNNLRDKRYIKPFAHLLQLVYPQLKLKEAINISYAVSDWVSPLNLNQGRSVFDTYYGGHHYTQAHLPMASPTEFRLIKGVNAEIYQKTLPYLTALPKKTPININHASLYTLQTVGAGLSEKQAKAIIEARGKKGFVSTKAFLSHEKMQALHLQLNQKDYTFTSDYFLSTVIVKHADDELTLYTLIERLKNKKKSDTHIIKKTVNII